MARTIVIGDLHGCRRELLELLREVDFADGDRVVAVGDLVVRGPDPAGTLAVLREVGARAVRGNHEERVLRWYAARGTKDEPSLGDMTKATVRALSDEDFAMLRALPLWLDLPEHDVRVVHAGVEPGVPIEEQDPVTLVSIRGVNRKGKPVFSRGETPWGAVYTGPPHVVFGHNADAEPQVHPWATGIDTGCVYGGRLTAMVLEEGQPPPPVRTRREVLVSVKARKAYVKI